MKIKIMAASISLVALSTVAAASPGQTSAESNTTHYFNSIKADSKKLTLFLQHMPKGGDLHNHASGATYAENLLHYARNDNLCINLKNFVVSNDPSCASTSLLNQAVTDPKIREQVIDAWSMRHFQSGVESGHDHFFATFAKFGVITNNHRAEILAEIAERAGVQNESYLELMITADGNQSGRLGRELGWNADFTVMRNKLLAANFPTIINSISTSIDKTEQEMRSIMTCDTDQPSAGCTVKIRYLYQVLREQAPEMVFAQLLAGFEAASRDKRVVGLNMVQPEDGLISMRDYKLHMQMIAYLHQIYPQVPISLHAGELTEALVPQSGLQFHIHDAVEVAQAKRIGHGVDIQQENHNEQLLSDMANKGVLVEINLSSNAGILNVVSRDNHPLPLYLRYEVPVTLSTDDEGVSRSNLTTEYVRAAQTFQLEYITLKEFARNSLAYSFLPGKTLWRDTHYQNPVKQCEKDQLGTNHPSAECQFFLSMNEKAKLQWDLESRFIKFESQF